MKLLNAYVKNEYGTTSFDWTGFKQSIDDYKGDDLTFDKFSQGNTSDAKQTVKELVDKVVVYIHDVFNGPVDVTKLTQTILTTITSLQQKAGYGYLNFNPIDNKKSSWEYRVVAFAPMPTLKSYFYGTVITIKVTADVGEEFSWWGLEEESSMVFSASTSALSLLVGKDYQYTTSK
ncbi:hypothetical protein AX16_002009 [Volvariella volvacea WC 439]|nr:hypothetical protein AX16_002009 [Volvariella volvacea WC 439]